MRQFLLLAAASACGALVTLVALEPRGLTTPAAAEDNAELMRKLREMADGPAALPPVASGRREVMKVTAVEATESERIANSVYEAASDAVVNIAVTTLRRVDMFRAVQSTGDSGSGVIIDRRGYVLTNFHVIESARQVIVTLSDDREFVGELVGADPLNDIALIKIDPDGTDLPTVPLGSSADLFVGQSVYAIGNPFGLQRTLSIGTVAALDRPLQVSDNWLIKSVIQIDAAINPGNSGGPLLDAAGRLIGINTAIKAEARQSAGIGLALPVDLIRRSLPDLIEHGRVIRGDLGIERLSEGPQGLRVIQLTPDGPAEKAGVLGPLVEDSRDGQYIVRRIDRSRADRIVALDGETVETAAQLFALVDGKRPGETVTLTVLRDKELVRVRVTLGED